MRHEHPTPPNLHPTCGSNSRGRSNYLRCRTYLNLTVPCKDHFNNYYSDRHIRPDSNYPIDYVQHLMQLCDSSTMPQRSNLHVVGELHRRMESDIPRIQRCGLLELLQQSHSDPQWELRWFWIQFQKHHSKRPRQRLDALRSSTEIRHQRLHPDPACVRSKERDIASIRYYINLFRRNACMKVKNLQSVNN